MFRKTTDMADNADMASPKMRGDRRNRLAADMSMKKPH